MDLIACRLLADIGVLLQKTGGARKADSLEVAGNS